MSKLKQLTNFLFSTSGFDENVIKTGWDGERWIAVIDLPLIGKFGVSSNLSKKAAIDDAVDHAVSLIEKYRKEHPEVKIEESCEDIDFELVEKRPGIYALQVK